MDKLAWKKDILPLLPKRLNEAVEQIDPQHAQTLEELRIRVDRPVQAIGNGWEVFFGSGGECTADEADIMVTQPECVAILDAVAFHSVYALEEELRRGCITMPSGYRVGLSGRALVCGGKLERLSGCTYFGFRIARETRGCATALLPYIVNSGQQVVSTLILSAPGCGKTTLLRDLARQISNGENRMRPQKVCVADERSEIAGCCGGVPQNDVGVRTDVLDGCPKAEAMELLLRALSPQVLVTDEIGRDADYHALLQAANSGVVLLASAHAGGIPDMRRRPLLRSIYDAGIFERYVLLSRTNGPGTIAGIYDGALNPVRSAQGRNLPQ